jgi:GntR family transcriptional regulator / MocR family aminotransferase
VAHVGTVSKTLAPGIWVGWITAPATLIEPLVATSPLPTPGPRRSASSALADLLVSGEYERHVAAARRAYRRRRDMLARELVAKPPALPVRGAAAWMQLLLQLPSYTDDIALAGAAAAQGINISPLTPLHLTPSRRRGLLVGLGRLPEHNIPAGSERDCLGGQPAASHGALLGRVRLSAPTWSPLPALAQSRSSWA